MRIKKKLIIALFFGLTLPFFTSFIYFKKINVNKSVPSCNDWGCLPHSDGPAEAQKEKYYCINNLGLPIKFLNKDTKDNSCPDLFNIKSMRLEYYFIDIVFWSILCFVILTIINRKAKMPEGF